MAFKVVVDSSADIPKEYADQAGIIVVPMPVIIDSNNFLEGIDILPSEFYAKFPTFIELPKTSQPNLYDLVNAYEKVLSSGNEVIAVHLSSGLSSTFSSAFLAKDMTSNPDKIHIFDSLGASLGYGLLALIVNEYAQTANSIIDIESKLKEIRHRMRYIFTLDTIDYLVKGGRVSKTSGFIGGLLDIKPILHLTPDGKIEALGKVRSRRAAIRKLVETIKQEISNPEDQIIGISHSDCIDDARLLRDEIKTQLAVKDILISDIGCVIGSHTGPGTIALFYQR